MTEEGIRLIVYTTVRPASPQNCLGTDAKIRRVRTMSRICLCLHYALPFCWGVLRNDECGRVPSCFRISRKAVYLYSGALSDKKNFNFCKKLCFNHCWKFMIDLECFCFVMHQISPCILRKIINKMNKMTRSSHNRNRRRTPNMRM